MTDLDNDIIMAELYFENAVNPKAREAFGTLLELLHKWRGLEDL